MWWNTLYGEVEGLVSVERWSCSRGASCVVEYIMGRLRDLSLWRDGLVAEVCGCVWWDTQSAVSTGGGL